MDLSEKEKSGMEKSDCPMNYTTSDWQLGCANFMRPPVSLVPTNCSIMNPSVGSSVSFEDSLCPSIWDTAATTLRHSLSPFPADSTFIERASRVSCFNSTGNFSNMMMYPLGVSEPVDHSSNGGSIQGHQLLESDQGVQLSSIKPTKENTEVTMRGEQNLNSTASKSNARQGKENSQNSDAPKEDYIHVRARRGQATNSHSLAERVRREKISERMKYLQDLVPGCSKVTGKAVMLDEIINYVQSLQRQVEFLSMKLAAVNPHIALNFEGLLSKDLHPSSHGLIQAGISGIGTHSDLLRRTINSQLTTTNAYKEMTLQTGNAWDEGLQNVVQMSFGMNAPLNVQELNGSFLPSALMKAEP